MTSNTCAVIIPCYKVSNHVLDVIRKIGPEIQEIVVVDDCCPENSVWIVSQNCSDPRVSIVRNKINLGVGGATLEGMKFAFEKGHTILIKMDGDDQMDPSYLKTMIKLIESGRGDFVKGNRFFNLEDLSNMPKSRVFGNAVLSFLSKLSSGYYHIFDPTNGYFALHRAAFESLPLNKISKRYFFESDLLFRLYLSRAVAIDLPMRARYGDEVSNLKIHAIIFPFLKGHFKNFGKRLFYSYFLRDFSIASLYLMSGIPMLIAGTAYGSYEWLKNTQLGVGTPAGTVMLAGLPIILGFNFILSFFTFDFGNIPKEPIHQK